MNRNEKIIQIGKDIIAAIAKHEKFLTGTQDDRIGIVVGMTASRIANLEMRMTEMETTMNELLDHLIKAGSGSGPAGSVTLLGRPENKSE